jgi:hypothetical protein
MLVLHGAIAEMLYRATDIGCLGECDRNKQAALAIVLHICASQPGAQAIG